MQLCSQFHASAALSMGKYSPVAILDRKLGGVKSHSGRGGEEKNSQPLPRIRPWSYSDTLVTILTELLRLLCDVFMYMHLPTHSHR
jgi:hypothetical protein